MFVIFYIFIYLFIESWFLSALMMIAQSNVSIHTYENRSIYLSIYLLFSFSFYL